MRRIGLFGGTFDPVHLGHIRLAQTAQEELNLDTIVFIPAAIPPHKHAWQLAPFHHRVQMLRLALAGMSEFEICQIEASLPAPTYTVDTLRSLQTTSFADAEIFFLIGLDAFLEICTWKCYDEVLSKVSMVVSARSQVSEQSKSDLARKLGYIREEGCWRSKTGKKEIYFLLHPPLQISSSSIREGVRVGNSSVAEELPTFVWQYIQQHDLYHLQ